MGVTVLWGGTLGQPSWKGVWRKVCKKRKARVSCSPSREPRVSPRPGPDPALDTKYRARPGRPHSDARRPSSLSG